VDFSPSNTFEQSMSSCKQTVLCASRFAGSGRDLLVKGWVGSGRVKRIVGGLGCEGVARGSSRSSIVKVGR